MSAKPILWHIPVSHYSEKARWALAHKRIEHERRTPMPGAHMAVAAWLTRGSSVTLPVLRLDGRTIGDSTAIIAALEESRPEPALYPADPADRRRALDLEDHFDRDLGPSIRRLGWYELTRDPERMKAVSTAMAPPALARASGFARRYGSAMVRTRYGAGSERGAEEARQAVVAALDRLEAELDGREHLVGDSFTVADLTAAALFYPLVLPPEGPQLLADPPAGFARFRENLADRPGFTWVQRTFARYRTPDPA